MANFIKYNVIVFKLSLGHAAYQNFQLSLGFKSCAFFPLASVVVQLLAILGLLATQKGAKHIWDPCSHLGTETGI